MAIHKCKQLQDILSIRKPRDKQVTQRILQKGTFRERTIHLIFYGVQEAKQNSKQEYKENNSRCRKYCFESNYNFDVFLLLFLLEYIPSKIHCNQNKIGELSCSYTVSSHYFKIKNFFFYFNCIGLVSQEKVFLSYKFFCIKKIHRLIQVLCFLEIVTRYRKEVDATKLQKIVQIVFIKEKKEGRQVRKELFRTGKLF